MDWETISHQIIVEEETPNHERLLEWQERYPEYSKEIAECITLLQQIRSGKFDDGPFPKPEGDFEKFLPQGIEPIAIPMPRQRRIVEK